MVLKDVLDECDLEAGLRALSERFDTVESVDLSSASVSVAVLGTGNYGVAFAERLVKSGSEVHVVLASRRGEEDPNGFPMPCRVTTFERAVQVSSIVIFAVPPVAHEKLVDRLGDRLEGKVIVDVSNAVRRTYTDSLTTCLRRGYEDYEAGRSNAERLQTLIEKAGINKCHVVKAFNNISAYSLSMPPGSPGAMTKACMVSGDDEAAKKKVAILARRMRFEVMHLGGLEASLNQENVVHRFFEGWKVACGIGFFLSLAFLLYVTLAYFVGGLIEWDEYPTKAFLIVTGDVSATLLALSFFPGPLAALLQLARGTARRPFPAWFASWLQIRKQLGLLAFFVCVPHVIIACMRRVETLNRVGNQLAPVFGTIAFALFYCMATCSNSSVSGHFTWSEFKFIFVNVGYATVTFTVCHLVCILAIFVQDYGNLQATKTPPSVIFALCMCGLSLVLKFVVSSPPISPVVEKIRANYDVSLLPRCLGGQQEEDPPSITSSS
mmetsp:Transcript_4384/g.13286  ORF Transcript_4384/g.13286 Transcript_4384/m.13286 type:complete len:494 (-) Transcript_4384:139-1620(-)